MNVFLNGEKILMKGIKDYTQALGIVGSIGFDSVSNDIGTCFEVCVSAKEDDSLLQSDS